MYSPHVHREIPEVRFIKRITRAAHLMVGSLVYTQKDEVRFLGRLRSNTWWLNPKRSRIQIVNLGIGSSSLLGHPQEDSMRVLGRKRGKAVHAMQETQPRKGRSCLLVLL